MFRISPDNNDELQIINKGLHNSLDNNFNKDDGIPSVPKVCVIFSLFYLFQDLNQYQICV